jgi:DNA invertase Pin-like site-specific DNA recombinase
MPNIYGYVRVSTRSQEYDIQVDAIKNFCKLKDYTLLKIFEDKASGKDTDRPGFQEMIKSMEHNPQNAEVIIVTKLDRVGRSIRDLIKFIDWCLEKKTGFVAIGSNIDTTTSQGRLFFYIMSALSEYERELIAERTETGRKRFVERGGRLGKPLKKLNIQEIKRLVNEGVPKAQVARRFDVSRQTIYQRLKP